MPNDHPAELEGQRAAANRLPRAVLALGLVSLFTDLSSEMIYPLLPAFLVGVLGAGAVSLGVIEGLAECAAAVLKVLSGRWSDRWRRRKPLVVAGYGLSGTARPLIGLAGSWPAVLGLRLADRAGKGLRTAPRDALIAGVTASSLRGRAYGLHRAMDHTGAVLGPLVAAALLAGAGLSTRHVFLLAAVPAVVVIGILLLGVREPPRAEPAIAAQGRAGWRELDAAYKRLLVALVLFTLGNSTDAFLLLRFADAGLAPHAVALIWSLHHAVKVVGTYAGGRLCDRFSRRAMLLCGWVIYAAVYLAFASLTTTAALVAAFLIYGLYFGLTEPAERAWIADLAPGALSATAFGYYHGAVGLAALPASVLFGAIWKLWGASAAFRAGAALATAAALLLAAAVPRDRA